jgi:nucleoside-diphosphate-sugar epimerase
MKILFVGGTGLISSACSKLAVQRGHDVILLNRSASRLYPPPEGSATLQADIHTDSAHLSALLQNQRFEAVVDFLAFTPEDIQQRLELFRDKTDQFVFISSASAYQKPVRNYLITEETPLENPFWQYSRDKIACENLLMDEFRTNGFPVTIVRPSHTYGPTQIPLIYGSWLHPWTLISRMKQGKPVIVPGDGTSLWVLTWNEDFAKGLLGLLGNKNAAGEAFHITSDEVLTWNQIFLEAYQTLGAEPRLVHIPSDFIVKHDPAALGTLIGDKSNSAVFDNTKIKNFVPEFNCEVKWSEGVRRALAWYEAHPEFQTIDHEANAKWDRILEIYGRR